MFTFDTLVDTAVTNSKKVIAYVENKEIRESLEGVVDAQAELGRSVYNYSKDLGNTWTESFKKVDLKQWDFSKLFDAVTEAKKSK